MSLISVCSIALLLVINHQSSAQLQPDWENSNDFLGSFLNLRYKPVSINVNTNTLQLVSPPTPLDIIATEYFNTVTVNTGQSIQTVNAVLNLGNATGGLLPGTFIRLGWTYYWAKNWWNGQTGTTINGKGFPMEVRVLWRNSKYHTLTEAVMHQDGLMELLFVYEICSFTNPQFTKVITALNKIQTAGSFTIIPASVHIDASNYISADGTYYSYLGSYKDTYTGLEYKCSRVIFVKPNPTYCITQSQFQQTFSNINNFCGAPYANTLPHDNSFTPVLLVKGGIIQNLLTQEC